MIPSNEPVTPTLTFLHNETTTSGLAATIGPLPIPSHVTAQSTVPNIVVQINGPIGGKLLVASGYFDEHPLYGQWH
jgi:hypothetical protein